MDINYHLLPSLQRISLVTLSIWLWNQENVRKFISQFDLSESRLGKERKWKKIENDVLKTVQLLPLPERLRNQLLGFIKPIGLQMLTWFVFHYEHLDFAELDENVWYPKKFCWSVQGTIDRRKTAEIIVKDQNIDVYTRFKFACVYCLEDDIKILWKNLDYPYRDYIMDDPNYKLPLVLYWACTVNNKPIPRDLTALNPRHAFSNFSLNANAFRFSAEIGFEAASRYFLSKITEEEKHRILVETGIRVAYGLYNSSFLSGGSQMSYCTEMLYFLLTSMTEEEQLAVFKVASPSVILKCFLNWPLQDLFLEIVEKAEFLFAERNYRYLLHDIVLKVRKGYKDYDYQELFTMFWQQVPVDYKRHVISDRLFVELIEIGDDKNLKFIITTLTPSEKQSLTLFPFGHNLCALLLHENKWDLLEFFIRECATSRDSVVGLRRQCEGLTKSGSLADQEKENVDTKLLRLFNEMDLKWALDELLDDMDLKLTLVEDNADT